MSQWFLQVKLITKSSSLRDMDFLKCSMVNGASVFQTENYTVEEILISAAPGPDMGIQT